MGQRFEVGRNQRAITELVPPGMRTLGGHLDGALEQAGPHQGALHVCMITDCFPPGIGGIENHVYALTCELAALGHTVTVVTHSLGRRRDGSEGPSVSLPERVGLVELPGFVLRHGGGDPALDLRMAGRFRRVLATHKFDIAHGHTLESLFVLSLLGTAKRFGLPTVFTKHSMVARASRPWLFSSVGAYWMASQARRFDAGIAVSHTAGDELLGRGVPITVIENGIDATRFSPDLEARRAIRKVMGYGPDSVVIGFVSRFVESKGVLDLPALARSVSARVQGIRFLMVGEGPLRAEVQRQMDALGLSDRVVFEGPKPWEQVPAFLNAMDVFVFPSRSEGFGMALVEAMACGLACVTTDDSGTNALVRDGETGFVAENVDQMAERVVRLANDPAMRIRIGHAARMDVARSYSWRAAALKTSEVYRQAILRRSKQP